MASGHVPQSYNISICGIYASCGILCVSSASNTLKLEVVGTGQCPVIHSGINLTKDPRGNTHGGLVSRREKLFSHSLQCRRCCPVQRGPGLACGLQRMCADMLRQTWKLATQSAKLFVGHCIPQTSRTGLHPSVHGVRTLATPFSARYLRSRHMKPSTERGCSTNGTFGNNGRRRRSGNSRA